MPRDAKTQLGPFCGLAFSYFFLLFLPLRNSRVMMEFEGGEGEIEGVEGKIEGGEGI